MISRELQEHMDEWVIDCSYDDVDTFTEAEICRGLHKGFIDTVLHEQWHDLTDEEQVQLWQQVQQRHEDWKR